MLVLEIVLQTTSFDLPVPESLGGMMTIPQKNSYHQILQHQQAKAGTSKACLEDSLPKNLHATRFYYEPPVHF